MLDNVESEDVGARSKLLFMVGEVVVVDRGKGGELIVGDGAGTAGRSPPSTRAVVVCRGSCNGRTTFGIIVTADEDGDSIAEAVGRMGEDGEGVEVDVEEEKVQILEDGNDYLPVPFKEVPPAAAILLLPFDIIDLCKLPDDFFFNPPAGNDGNISLFIPLVEDIIGGAAGLKISFGVTGIGILRVEHVDEGVPPLPLPPTLLL